MRASAGSAGFDHEVDLLVLGAGAAGMTAALVAAIEGFQPLLCEKTGRVGGTSARSSGGIWVPGNRQTAQRGRPDSLAAARAYLGARLGPDEHPLREKYLSTAPAVVDYLEANSDVRFAPIGMHPDYWPYDGAARGGRPLQAEAFDGRQLGKDFELVAPPLPALMALGGMMVGRADIPALLRPLGSAASLRRAAGLLGRYARDRPSHSRGTRLLMGNALVARLFYSLKKRGVPIWLGAPAVELLRENGTVAGAVIDRGGEVRRVRARFGVVLATGGFSHGPGWRGRLMLAREAGALSLASEGCTGDGLTLAEAGGAVVARGGIEHAAVWAPVSVMKQPDGRELRYPHFFMDRPKPGIVAVNRRGRRFTNEAASYHDFVAGMLTSAETASELPAYLVCDHRFLRRYGLGLVLPGHRRLRPFVKAGYLALGRSLAELAGSLGIDAAGLAETVDRNNRFADAGTDEDFGKGSSFFNRFHGDPAVGPNPCLGRIEQPPFAAIRIWPADLSTHAGVAADAHCQALDARGIPIPGLHVCGNDLATIWGGEAPGPGVTLGPAVIFGYHAAMHAVGGGPAAANTRTNP